MRVDVDAAGDPLPAAAGAVRAATEPGAPPERSAHRPRWRRRAGATAALVALLAVPVGLQAEVAGQSRAADRARVRAEAAAGARRATAAQAARDEARRAEAQHDAQVVAGTLSEQRARLVELGLTEATMERILREVRSDAERREAERGVVAAGVARQDAEIPQLKECLDAARRAIDAAFHAQSRTGVAVPSPSEICRALGAVPPSNAARP